MYCPHCLQPNMSAAPHCRHCQQDLSEAMAHVFIGEQFVFARADDQHPLALQVDGEIRVFRAPTVLTRHLHTIGFGDEAATEEWHPSLIDLSPLAPPVLRFLTLVTDRKIYRPGDDATLFIIAPDAASTEVAVEIKLGGQKIYEAKVPLGRDGLALHHYADLKEGEYTVALSLPGQPGVSADCAFSVAEFVLSPFIATLEEHRFSGQVLTFSLKVMRLSVPYSGPVEFGLQCAVCGERVVATQKTTAQDGTAQGEFDLSGHGGPFHVQVTTPEGDTAALAFPGTGAQEREAITVSELGAQVSMSLLPREEDEPMRGFYLGTGGVNMTPLMLEQVCAPIGQLRAAAELTAAQVVVFDPRARAEPCVLDRTEVKCGELIEFDSDAPYTLFTVGAFQRDQPWEGWGMVIKPIGFEATLHAPATAKPGDLIDVALEATEARGLFCWLLVYDARLEHESPLPKLAKRIYESVRAATRALTVGDAKSAQQRLQDLQTTTLGGGVMRSVSFAIAPAAAPPSPQPMRAMAAMLDAAPRALFKSAQMVAEAVPEAPAMVVAPTRMEFPELVFNELFFMEGQAARTVKLGDQIGLWRVRAYVIDGVDVRELTADVQADKVLYAEVDVPAIASAGDDIRAAVNYFTREPAELIIATPWGEKRVNVNGAGHETIAIKGPGRVEARISTKQDNDWTQRDVAPPGVQRVTASHLMILDKGQSARGEKVVVYETPGQVLKDTITALIHYPFG